MNVPGPAVDCRTSYNCMERFLATGSILGTKRTCRRHVLIDKNVDEIGDRLLKFSRKSLINTLVSVSSVMRFNKTAAVAFV
jgi:hypothetical protein